MPPKAKKARHDDSSAGSPTVSSDPSSGFIRFEANLNNITSLYSPEIEVMGIPWRLLLQKHIPTASLAMYICHNLSDCDFWSVDVAGEITLINATKGKNVLGTVNSTYNNINTGWGRNSFCKWHDLIDEYEGFVKDGKITVEARFTLSKIVGYRTRPQIDFTNANDPRHDITLMINGEKIYVNKGILAVHSPAFEAMFYGDFAEKDKKEIELKDIDPKEFIEMLNMIYPSHQKITDDNVESLLSLADRFQITSIVDQIEQFYIASVNLDISFKLRLSDQYRFVKLQDHCLNSLITVKAITDLNKTENYKNYSKNLKGTLMDKIAKLSG